MTGPWARAILGVAATLALACVPAAQASGPQVTVLLHHPDDGVDPLGFPYAGDADFFTWRYASLVLQKDTPQFDYPFFIADGVVPIEGPVDPSKPYVAALDAYGQAVDDRLREAPPATLRLASVEAGDRASVTVGVEPVVPIDGEDLHLLVALTEDPVHYQPPPKLTNGIVDHRFTVRAVQDLGRVPLASATTWAANLTLADGWQRDRLHVAAWLQQATGSARFPVREVVQATSAPLGEGVVQDGKGVLVEMYSAIWCLPCGPGDLAIEAVAVAHGSAQSLPSGSRARYFEAPGTPALAIAAALAAGLAAAWWGGRR